MPLCGRKHNMYKTYILESINHGRYYVGSTEDIDARIVKHNSGSVKFTKPFRPWRVVYTEDHPTRSDAYKRELEIKGYKGGFKFKELIRRDRIEA
jgi:putative endonuclease